MKKKDWGTATWYLFHTLAEKLKTEYDNSAELKLLYSHIKKICYNLPCPDCQQHSIQTLSTVNENAVTSSKSVFIRFLWQFHNKVTRDNGGKEFSFEELTALYQKANTRLVIQNFITVMNMKGSDLRINMLVTKNKNMYMHSFIDYISKNNHKFN